MTLSRTSRGSRESRLSARCFLTVAQTQE